MRGLIQTMRWFGPTDPVTLHFLRQAGCEGVVTALHHIPPGEIWTITEINKRKEMITAAGMSWAVVESLPVSEDIKRRSGNWQQHIAHYIESMRNLAACGIDVITYNFMPVLDWVRTDIHWTLENGSRALRFERLAFIVFDVFLLRRPGADGDYQPDDITAAVRLLQQMTTENRETLFKNAMLGLPGTDGHFTRQQILSALDTYEGIDANALRQHLLLFLQAIIPTAEELGIRMAIHPDDPPFPVLGLPRVVSTAEDLQLILDAVPATANGLCFCTGSLGVLAGPELPDMVKRFGPRIHFLHLRNVQSDHSGNFYESDHLQGNTDMYAVMREVVLLMQRENRRIPMRPDHGHQMLDDLGKKTYPGYSAIGRLKGLAELRGLEAGIAGK
ncbi:mannonate dehydratase [Chitinophaga dinghuensis]|uniref:Mannonate dehydratase n=1 Tax=Chitinophaga dinghuensis TaxID=1539050 RepID=A0A327VW05_9BACT|nr:mannonate dehydratase [Chitinophaga dinghuensis]RAJ79086.1 mannonate dehydratase [Chitinophaga dinghuensis]